MHSNHLEKHICTLFLRHHDAFDVGEVLYTEFKQTIPNKKKDREEIESYLLFLIQAKLFEYFFSSISFLIQHAEYVPWHILLEGLSSCENINAAKKLSYIEKLLILLESEIDSTQFATCPKLLIEAPQLRSSINKRKQRLKQDYESEINRILAQIDWYKNEDLFFDEKQLLNKLKLLAPLNPYIKPYEDDLSLRHANKIIEDKAIKINYEPKENSHLEDRQPMNSFVTAILQENKTENSYDLAVTLTLLGEYAAALHACQNAPSNFEVDWLKAELLLLSKKSLELLSYLNTLENKYSTNPDTTIACEYFKAQALWQLHNKDEAIKTLELLATHNSEYRSTQELLNEWKNTRQEVSR